MAVFKSSWPLGEHTEGFQGSIWAVSDAGAGGPTGAPDPGPSPACPTNTGEGLGHKRMRSGRRAEASPSAFSLGFEACPRRSQNTLPPPHSLPVKPAPRAPPPAGPPAPSPMIPVKPPDPRSAPVSTQTPSTWAQLWQSQLPHFETTTGPVAHTAPAPQFSHTPAWPLQQLPDPSPSG